MKAVQLNVNTTIDGKSTNTLFEILVRAVDQGITRSRPASFYSLWRCHPSGILAAVVSHCSYDPAYITFPPRVNGLRCGCGWLFTCTSCQKDVHFGSWR